MSTISSAPSILPEPTNHNGLSADPRPDTTGERGEAVRPVLLLVDDDESGRATLQAQLSGDGYDLALASSGMGALALAEKLEPDLILLDVMMPDIDGFEVCEALRTHHRFANMPILMLTALDDKESRMRGLEAGADDFISRPVDFGILRARIRTITRLNRYRRIVEAESNLNRLFEQAPHGTIIVDRMGDVKSANEAAVRLIDPSGRSELTGKNLVGMVEPNDARILRSLFRTAVPEQERPQELECRFREIGGRSIPVQLQVTPFTVDGDSCFSIQLRDRSEVHAIESQLIRAQRMETLGLIVGGMAHDLNNLLAAIRLSVHTMQEIRDPDLAGSLLEGIDQASERGASILQRALDTVRDNHSGRGGATSAGAVIAEIAEIVRNTFPKSIQVRTTVAEQLPLVGMGVPELYQVLMNLCINARDALPQGGLVNLHVHLGKHNPDGSRPDNLRPEHDYVVIEVADTGTGIPGDVVGRIFEPLFTTKTGENGTGLGLSTTRQMLRSIGGDIALRTTVGKGTCFSVFLPLAQEDAPQST